MNDSIHVTTWGDGGPDVVFVHGSAQGTTNGGERAFGGQQRLADEGWRLIVPDRPGHGRSADPGRPDDADLDGAWVAELLGAGAHLVGHSFGGCVALAAAARRPAAVRSLTLIEPAMAPLAIADPAVRAYVDAIRALYTTAASPHDVALGFPTLVGIPEAMRDALPSGELERFGQALLRMRMPLAPVLQAQLEDVARAGIPLFVVTGGWSAAFAAIGAAAARTGGGEHVVIAAGHHFPQLLADQFNGRLSAFMTAADRRTAGSR